MVFEALERARATCADRVHREGARAWRPGTMGRRRKRSLVRVYFSETGGKSSGKLFKIICLSYSWEHPCHFTLLACS